MALAWLCQIDAFARDDGAATTIRLSSHDDDRLCHLNDTVWWPAIARLPTLAYDFFDGAFGGEIVTPSGRADLSIESVPGYAELMLHDAQIRWWSGELGAAWGTFTLRFDGKIDNHPALRDGVAGVEFRVDDRWLDDPILSTYAGTTGAEGDAALKGQVKPLMLGAPRMAEGVLVDPIDTIIQLSDGPIEGIEIAFENAQRFPAAMTNYASFAALDAATIAPSFVATSLAAGLARHGAPGDGVLTYDVRGSNSGADGGGWVRRTGAIVKRLAARQGKLAKVDTAALTALDTARPWNVSIALTSQTTMRELVQSLAQSINAVALVTWTGLLTILTIDAPEAATPIGTLASDGSANPPVARVDQLGIAPPFWRLAIEAEVTQRVHSSDEIRFTANLVEVGIYDDAETYREGNITSIEDGSRWLYIGVTPTAGNDPIDGSAFWSRLSESSTGPAGPAGSSNAVIFLYRRGATSPAVPTGTFTYSFLTGALSGGTLNSWTQAVPAADGNPLWVIAATASANTATDSIAAAEFSVPVLKDGAGLNTATVFLYQRSASAPSVPGATTTYTFATGVLAGTLGSWTQTVPAHNGNPLYVITATAVGAAATDTIATGEWSAVRVLAENGAPGTAGAPGATGATGATLYTWYAYADANDGTFNFSNGSPGGRFYQGIAYNKTTSTESTTPADYAWAPYEGPPNFGLANFDARTLIAGNKLIKRGLPYAGDGWDGSIYSTESYKNGASVSFIVDVLNKDWMVGLNTDPTTAADFGTLDFAIYARGDNKFQVYEGGGSAFVSAVDYAVGDVFTVIYNGKTVIYSRNGTAFYTNSSPSAGLSLFLDTSFHSSNTIFGRILSFTAAGTAGSDGSPGISPVLAIASPTAKQFAADADGTVKAGQLAFPVTITGTKAGSAITGTVTILGVSGCTATAASGGFTIDTVTADAGYVNWRFTATDGQIVESRVTISRQRDPTGGGQVLVNFSSTSWWGSGSYGASGPSTVLAASSTGKLKLTGYASFFSSTNGSATLTGKLQYRAVGSGTWIDAGISGSGVATRTIGVPGEPNDNTPGVIAITGTVTGLTADGSYEMQIVGNRSTGGNAISSATGYVSMQQVA
jgi:hypothetical protein